MLDLTEEQKRMFYTSGYSNNYVLTFPDIGLAVDNETLHSETPVIQESICDEEDLTLGGCIASSMEFTASEVIADQISGLEFTAKIDVLDEENRDVLSVPMGTYRVDSAKRVDDKDYKKVTAYDRLYDASVDVADWYNNLFSIVDTETIASADEDGNVTTITKNVYGTTTVKEMRESLLTHLGIPFVSQNLSNDEMTISKTVEPSDGSLPGTTVLKALCTVNGGFGRMNREGEFEVITLKGLGVFPEDGQGTEDNLYPEETLYPEDTFEYLGVSDEENEYPEYRSVSYEEYMVQPITCLNIQTDEEDAGVTIGKDVSNPYRITANFLLYGKSAEELEIVGQNIYKQLQGITYRPNTTELTGLPYMEVGDVFSLIKRTDTIESFIFSRTLTGIQALKDTYEAKGNEIRANEVSQSEEIQQLQGKVLSIKKQVDNFSVSLKDLSRDTQSLLNMTASNILLQVDKNGRVAAITLNGDEGAESVTIDLSAAKITIKSDNWTVNENGEMECKAITILGGRVNIETERDSDDSIVFKYVADETEYEDTLSVSMSNAGFGYAVTGDTKGSGYITYHYEQGCLLENHTLTMYASKKHHNVVSDDDYEVSGTISLVIPEDAQGNPDAENAYFESSLPFHAPNIPKQDIQEEV